MGLLQETLNRIQPVDVELLESAQAKLDNKTKPLGSLGRLEEFARRVAAITGSLAPDTAKKVIFTFAGDHGVVEEGVSAFPKEVTPQMVFNFLRGGAGVNVLARHSGAEVRVVDVGVDFDFEPTAGLIINKVSKGTRNFAKGPAMTRAEAIAALEVGIALADRAKAEGVAMLGTGDMGIGEDESAQRCRPFGNSCWIPGGDRHSSTPLGNPRREVQYAESQVGSHSVHGSGPSTEVLARDSVRVWSAGLCVAGEYLQSSNARVPCDHPTGCPGDARPRAMGMDPPPAPGK